MRNTLNKIAPGTVDFRRTVSVAWCSYSHVISLRNDLPDDIAGVAYISVDNPAQSPRIPIMCGTQRLPEAFSRCGHKTYDPGSILWTFRKANKLATLSWQTTKDDFGKTLLEGEAETLRMVRELQASPAPTQEQLDAITKDVFEKRAETWKGLEEKYWVQFGKGF